MTENASCTSTQVREQINLKNDQGTHVHELRENDSLNYETSDEQNLFTFIDNLKLFYPNLSMTEMNGKLQRYDYIDCYVKQKARFISQDM